VEKTGIAEVFPLNPLDLADCNLVFGPAVKFGGPGRLMRSHLLGMLEPASILQVNRHTGRARTTFDLMGQITKLEEIYFNAVSQRPCSSS
jgi:hypothetical protein